MATTTYGEVTSGQLSGGGGGSGGGTVSCGPFFSANTGSAAMGYGIANFAYVPQSGGSVLGVTIDVSSGQSGTVSVGLYKNGTLVVTAFSSVSFDTTHKTYVVTYASGTYSYASGDKLLLLVTTSSAALSIAGSIMVNAA